MDKRLEDFTTGELLDELDRRLGKADKIRGAPPGRGDISIPLAESLEMPEDGSDVEEDVVVSGAGSENDAEVLYWVINNNQFYTSEFRDIIRFLLGLITMEFPYLEGKIVDNWKALLDDVNFEDAHHFIYPLVLDYLPIWMQSEVAPGYLPKIEVPFEITEDGEYIINTSVITPYIPEEEQ